MSHPIDEKRFNAYLQLINALLSCPSGEEVVILSANQELLDADLVKTMAQVADELEQRGDNNASNFVINIALKLAEALGLSSTTIAESPQFKLLMELLSATAEGTVWRVYALLYANRNLLHINFAKLLNNWGREILTQVDSEQARNIAEIIRNFSILIQDYPSGKQAINLEIAIAGYEVIKETVFTRETSPIKWAQTQHNLGIAYCKRIVGDKAENLEAAIASNSDALKVYTHDEFPEQWAGILINLGTAFLYRIIGDRGDNLEAAITAYNAALKVYTRDKFSEEWAGTQNNLGIAYRNRIIGDRAENLEVAINAFNAALSITKRDELSVEWARMQSSLGNTYLDRIVGDKGDNLEAAIAAYNAALSVGSFGNLVDWAMTQNNLGVAYCKRIFGDKGKNLEDAISAYNAALLIRNYEEFPIEWAETQMNLGNAYLYRIIGDKGENLEAAITYCNAALKVNTHNALPIKWAMTQHSLGNAYHVRVIGDRAENLKTAITCYSAALKVNTRDALPFDHVQTLYALGRAYQEARCLSLAYSTFEQAIDTIEFLRGEIVSGNETKRKQAEEYNKLYQSMAAICLELKLDTQAFEYVERSKTRNLVELILERDSKIIFPPELVIQLEKYRDEITTGQYQIQNGKAENPQLLAQHLNQLRQQRNELQNQYLSVGSDFKFDSFKATLDKRTAIAEWYILDKKIVAFIIKPTGEITVWQSQPEDREALENWLDKYLQDYNNQKDKWKHSLGKELKTLASILHIDEILNLIPKDCDQLILIPHRFLHLLPLHALPVGENHQDSHCLLDLFTGGISYVPSCQLLQQVQKRERPNFESVFAIKNPTNDLAYTKLEVDNILNLFSSHQVLSHNQASKDTLIQQMPKLKEANYLHFSCHGSFNLNSPQDSCLLLAESKDENNDLDLNKCLTLGNLFEQDFQLDNCRLVVLSACETGLVDFTNASDEYISLPSGFLYAGSTSVVSSLWQVNDLSTAFMTIKFLQNLQAAMINGEDFSVAVSLNQAQKWLRNSTKTQLEEWIGEHKLNSEPTLRNQLRRRFHNIPSDSRPFESPFYWAAFCGVGM